MRTVPETVAKQIMILIKNITLVIVLKTWVSLCSDRYVLALFSNKMSVTKQE